jgi:hypothetical protein
LAPCQRGRAEVSNGTPDFNQPSSPSSTKESKIDSEQFFDAVFAAYQDAAAGNTIDRYYSIAGFPIRLSFAGPALIPYLTRALAHLAISPVPSPALTVHLWDSASTHTPLPSLPWTAEDLLKDGRDRKFNYDRFSASVQFYSYTLWILDALRNTAIYAVKSAEVVPPYEVGAPLRELLQSWMSRNGVLQVHAGAVGLKDGGVLLVGKGGVGKSSTALSCLSSELCYASDDFCLVAPEPTPTVFSLYSTGKLHRSDQWRLPHLAALASNPEAADEEKALYFLHEHVPEKILPAFPIRAIFIPRVAGTRAAGLEMASPAAALQAFAPSTLRLSPHESSATFPKLAQIVKQVPAYFLDLGSDAAQIPQVILNYLCDGPR